GARHRSRARTVIAGEAGSSLQSPGRRLSAQDWPCRRLGQDAAMIGSPRREGTLGPDTGRRSAEDRPWQNLDRRAPLWLKVISPVILVTVLGAALFGYVLAEQPPVVWIVVAGLAIGALEVAIVAALLEYGVLRRIRRVHRSVTALARSAAESRKPVLSGRLGQDSTYWDGQSDPYSAAAAFVPLAGTQVGAGVMIGLAHAGGRVTSSTVSLIESVATALTESLERREAGRARAESEEKSKTLATVTHEMRNPLNAMLGFSDLLLNDKAGPLNEKQRTYMQQVDSASRHLLSLVNDYLDLTRLVAGALPMQMEAVQIHPEVQEVFELLGPTAQAAQLTMHSSVEPGLVAQADRRGLHQVLLNLLTNALRSTPPRGHVRVAAAADDANEHLAARRTAHHGARGVDVHVHTADGVDRAASSARTLGAGHLHVEDLRQQPADRVAVQLQVGLFDSHRRQPPVAPKRSVLI